MVENTMLKELEDTQARHTVEISMISQRLDEIAANNSANMRLLSELKVAMDCLTQKHDVLAPLVSQLVKEKDQIDDIQAIHEVLGSLDPLSFPSEPPDIRNWFTSYVYESPLLDTMDNFSIFGYKEREDDIVINPQKACKEIGKDAKHFYDVEQRDTVLHNGNNNPATVLRCPNSVEDVEQENQTICKDGYNNELKPTYSTPSKLTSQNVCGQTLPEQITHNQYHGSVETLGNKDTEENSWRSRTGGGNGKVAYIDTEGTFRPDRIIPIAERFGMDPGAVLDNIIYARAYTYEHQYNLLLGLAAKMAEEPFRLLIVDSVIALFRVDFTGRGELADRQQKLAQMLYRLIKIAEEFNVAVYMTNQVIANPGGGVFISDPKKSAGGQFYQVLLYGLNAIRKACASLETNYQPAVMFAIVQKRHHTRLEFRGQFNQLIIKCYGMKIDQNRVWDAGGKIIVRTVLRTRLFSRGRHCNEWPIRKISPLSH